MRRYSLKVIAKTLILLVFLGGFPILVNAQAKEQETIIDKLEEVSQKQKEVEKAKENVEEVKIEAEAAKKDIMIQKKAVELEKKKAEVKLKEAETAKKEADVVRETAKSRKEINQAVEEASQKEKEAGTAIAKVKIAEEKVLVAQEKAKIAEEELILAQERAFAAEIKIKEKRSLVYKKILQTGIIILIGYLLIFLVVGIINRRIKDAKVKYVVRKNVVYLLNIIILLYIFFVWIQNINSITVFLSVMGAGIALALQEVILCIAGWFLIFIQRPFEVGDRVELGGVKGDVIDIRFFQTSLLEIGNWVEADQSTGRIVNVPNSAVFKKENYNYNRGFEFIWNEIKVLVTFESDWKRAEEIMISHATKEAEETETIVKRKIERMTKRYMIHYEKFTPIVYVDVKDSGVELSLRYLTEARKRRVIHNILCRAILDDFEKEEKVNFAYPTYRIVK